jgi:hypothetical protein
MKKILRYVQSSDFQSRSFGFKDDGSRASPSAFAWFSIGYGQCGDGIKNIDWNNSASAAMSLYEYVEKQYPMAQIKGKL